MVFAVAFVGDTEGAFITVIYQVLTLLVAHLYNMRIKISLGLFLGGGATKSAN